MEVIEKITKNGKTLAIHLDEWPENPRDAMDCLGTMLCWNRRYDMGSRADKTVRREFDPDHYQGWEELEKAVSTSLKPAVILPVFMYEHSGVSLNTTGFSCPWDSGRVGFILATRQQILTFFDKKRLTQELRERAKKVLADEVETYSSWVNGDVYGFTVTDDETDEVIDSCSGFYTNNFETLKKAAGWE